MPIPERYQTDPGDVDVVSIELTYTEAAFALTEILDADGPERDPGDRELVAAIREKMLAALGLAGVDSPA